MITVGLTGGIGSGKSYVAQQFARHNIPCYNSDIRAKELTVSNEYIVANLKSRFGENVFEDGRLNKTLVAQRIFSDSRELQWMNSLVHPVVRADFDQWRISQQSDIVMLESAILVESGFYRLCDKIVSVEAPISLRISRVVQRDGLSEEQVRQRIGSQIADEERRNFADFVVVNDEMNNIAIQIDEIVLRLHNKQ